MAGDSGLPCPAARVVHSCPAECRLIQGAGSDGHEVVGEQEVHHCADRDCRVESVRTLRWQIEDLTIALADAMACPDDLVVLASVRAFLTLRDVLQELDASPISRCHGKH